MGPKDIDTHSKLWSASLFVLPLEASPLTENVCCIARGRTQATGDNREITKSF